MRRQWKMRLPRIIWLLLVLCVRHLALYALYIRVKIDWSVEKEIKLIPINNAYYGPFLLEHADKVVQMIKILIGQCLIFYLSNFSLLYSRFFSHSFRILLYRSTCLTMRIKQWMCKNGQDWLNIKYDPRQST